MTGVEEHDQAAAAPSESMQSLMNPAKWIASSDVGSVASVGMR